MQLDLWSNHLDTIGPAPKVQALSRRRERRPSTFSSSVSRTVHQTFSRDILTRYFGAEKAVAQGPLAQMNFENFNFVACPQEMKKIPMNWNVSSSKALLFKAPVGQGKTHWLWSFKNEIKESLYTTGGELRTAFATSALAEEGEALHLITCQQIPLLLIDDAEDFFLWPMRQEKNRKEDYEKILCELLDMRALLGLSTFMTSSLDPDLWAIGHERLIRRLKAMPLYEFKSPFYKFTTRKSHQWKQEFSKFSKERLLAVLEEVTQEKARDILGMGRDKNLVRARHLGMYILHVHYSLPFMAVGAFFERDHSTVIYAVKNIRRELLVIPELARMLEKMTSALDNSLGDRQQ